MVKNKSMWVEEERPDSLDKIILPERIKNKFKNGVTKHVLFVGSPGTGKTTLAKILVKHKSYKFINASLNNGVDYIRTEISDFASLPSILSNSVKLIVLDECDYLSESAQAALRGVMEKYQKTVLFILTCNYPERLTDAILSRAEPIDFNFSGDDANYCVGETYKMLETVLSKRGYTIEKDALIHLMKSMYPDIRSMVDTLQGVSESLDGNIRNITLPDVTASESNANKISKLYTFLQSCPSTVNLYTELRGNYFGKERDVIVSFGNEFITFLKNNDLGEVIGYVAVLVHKYGIELNATPNKFITLFACCTELVNVLKTHK